jgi:hypothetical protein
MRFSAAQVGHSKARPSASLKSLRERQGGLAMAGRRTAPQVVLSESERSELKGLAGRRKTAQAMAMRARIVLACAEGCKASRSQHGWALMRLRSENGAGALRRSAWMGSTTSRGRGPRAPSRTRVSKL